MDGWFGLAFVWSTLSEKPPPDGDGETDSCWLMWFLPTFVPPKSLNLLLLGPCDGNGLHFGWIDHHIIHYIQLPYQIRGDSPANPKVVPLPPFPHPPNFHPEI